jgi:hypothetical protein
MKPASLEPPSYAGSIPSSPPASREAAAAHQVCPPARGAAAARQARPRLRCGRAQEIETYLANEEPDIHRLPGRPAPRGGAGAASVSGIDLRSALAVAPVVPPRQAAAATPSEEEEDDEDADGIITDFLNGL